MKSPLPLLGLLQLATTAALALSPESLQKLPPAVNRPVDFVSEIKPLFEAACIKCHAKGKDKGGFSLETRETFLKGGDTGAGAIIGKSAESVIVEAVSGLDGDLVMPKKGKRWSAEQVGLLRAWIDQGAAWPAGITFAKPEPENLHPRAVATTLRSGTHPIDQLLASRLAALPGPVEDRIFARRVYLDLIGLLPTPAQLDAFLADAAPDKRTRLVRQLLADKRNYTEHWLTFWNDLLRNDYKGAGFIDGGRKQISNWLYQALIENKPYDRFVAELVNPSPASEGFSRGIIWRGSVNASMLPPMQAAQSVSQVFLGVNLKCASCHDSFVSDWTLADAYGMAAIYSDEPMELVHCDKPTGKKAAMRFLYPEFGALDPASAKEARLQRFAEIITAPSNGRLSRTIVNRLWARMLGHGLVEPLDDMEKRAWEPPLLDWLAEDFVAHGYDLKHTLEVICTSAAYQLPPTEGPREGETFVFHGPLTRRLSAEQFADAISALTNDWARLPSTLEFDFRSAGVIPDVPLPKWIWTSEPLELGPQRTSVRAAQAQLDLAAKNLAEARTKAADALDAGGRAVAATLAAGDRATKALAAAQWHLANVPTAGDGARHKVVFRKMLTLEAAPAQAYAVVLASQRVEVQVNGKVAKATQRDGFRNGRVILFNVRSLLQPGENIVAIDVSSHTEKAMNDVERVKFPGSTTHLNAQSGLAFYLQAELPDGTAVHVGTDEGWSVRRAPTGAWNAAVFSDADWAKAVPLPEGVAPVDEGPSLEPRTRKDFANLPVELGSQLSSAVSTVAQPGRLRASLLAADTLQVALDRPNREVVMPARATFATTIQALELTNGATLNNKLQWASARLGLDAATGPDAWLDKVFRHALSRHPTAPERAAILDLLGDTPKPEDIADLLWSLVNLPEFQLIN